jgi:microcystin-dependent protein
MEVFVANVILFAGNYPPKGWAFCDGSLLPIQMNQALFSIIGTMYGGDGIHNFALPDLRGRVALGFGQSTTGTQYTQGEVLGQETVTLNTQNLPTHNHLAKVPVTESQPTSDVPNGNILAAQNSNFYAAASTADGQYGGVNCSVTGQNQAIDIRKPYLTLNYIIALQGIYPSRS